VSAALARRCGWVGRCEEGNFTVLWRETLIYGGKQRNEKERKDSFGICEKHSFWGWSKLKEYEKGFLHKRKESKGFPHSFLLGGVQIEGTAKGMHNLDRMAPMSFLNHQHVYEYKVAGVDG
jgi:hypothetical protein